VAAGLGEEVTVSAGKHADTVVRLPPGALLSWRWGSVDAGRDVGFRVTAVPLPAGYAGPLPKGTVDLPALAPGKTVLGVHLLAAGAAAGGAAGGAGKDAHAPVTEVKHVHTDGDLAAPLAPAGVTGEVDVVASARVSNGKGHWSAPGDGGGSLVRLRWDNTYSWMTAKTLVRRIDVYGPAHVAAGAAGPAPPPDTVAVEGEGVVAEVDPLEVSARLRMRHLQTFGL
jgi:hypothetical protein